MLPLFFACIVFGLYRWLRWINGQLHKCIATDSIKTYLIDHGPWACYQQTMHRMPWQNIFTPFHSLLSPPFFVETSKMSYNMHAFSLLHLHNTRVFGFDGRIADICVWLSQCDPYTEKTIRHFNDGVSSARLDLPKVRYAYFMLILEMKGIFYSLSTIPSLLFPFINARS